MKTNGIAIMAIITRTISGPFESGSAAIDSTAAAALPEPPLISRVPGVPPLEYLSPASMSVEAYEFELVEERATVHRGGQGSPFRINSQEDEIVGSPRMIYEKSGHWPQSPLAGLDARGPQRLETRSILSPKWQSLCREHETGGRCSDESGTPMADPWRWHCSADPRALPGPVLRVGKSRDSLQLTNALPGTPATGVPTAVNAVKPRLCRPCPRSAAKLAVAQLCVMCKSVSQPSQSLHGPRNGPSWIHLLQTYPYRRSQTSSMERETL